MAANVAKIDASTVREGLAPHPRPKKQADWTGHCWFRDGALCPFSVQGMKEHGITDKTRLTELQHIYELCGDPETHRRAPADP